MSQWCQYPFDFLEIQIQIYQGHTKETYQISFRSNIRELSSIEGKLTENVEKNMNIA